MGQNSITMFTNDSGVAGGPIQYVQDAFSDVSDTPTNNSGFSSTISSNPLNNLYANDDFPRLGPKTLWIKDLVLEQTKSLWINGEPTYRIIWNEPFPSAQGYVYGNISLTRNKNQTYVTVRSIGDGFGVGGVFRRVMFLMQGTTTSSVTANVAVDGVANTTSIDWSGLTSTNPANDTMFSAFAHSSSNETYDIHDFRIKPNQAGSAFTISGVIVYSENSALSIDQFPGTTYNNKTQSRTSVSTTIPLPSFGCSLGGRSVIWKTAASGYSMSTIGVSTITSIAQGSSGTNILNVTAGQGSSFLSGYGIISAWGSSSYVGIIQSISTDALTVFPTLPFGISNAIYRYFQSGQSLAINASLNILAYQLGPFTTTPLLDPQNNYCVWGTNFGTTLIDNTAGAMAFAGASGFIQVEGYFSAAEIEWYGMSFGVLSGTMMVNGFGAYNHSNIGFTGVLKKSVFIEAGPGWNQFSFSPGSSHINVGISKLNLYQRQRDISASFGIISQFDSLQTPAFRTTNATLCAPGTYKRYFADQLLLKGGGTWTRLTGATWPGGVAYAGGLSAALSFQYFGSHFAFIGGMSLGSGASIQISVDNGSNLGATSINTLLSFGSTFHSVSLIILGGTLYLSALDICRQYGEMQNLQSFSSTAKTNLVQTNPVIKKLTSGSGNYVVPSGVKYLWVRAVGGGGGGGAVDANNGTQGGNTIFGPYIAIGGSGGNVRGGLFVGGSGGTGGTGNADVRIPGGGGGAAGSLTNMTSQPGGNSAFGGGAPAAGYSNPGISAGSNTGGGGSGTNITGAFGAGGGGGEYFEIMLSGSNLSTNYPWTVGSSGAGGADSANTGGNGGSGLIILYEFY